MAPGEAMRRSVELFSCKYNVCILINNMFGNLISENYLEFFNEVRKKVDKQSEEISIRFV